jgi:hypothetical protein
MIWLSAIALVGVSLPLAVSAQTEATVQQKKLTLVAVPADRGLPIPPPTSALSADSVVLQRINEVHAGSRLVQMDFLGEGTVTVQTDDGPLAFGVRILRNGLRAQHIEFKQSDGKFSNIGAGPLDPIARRILAFLQTQYDRGLASLLQSETRDASVRDGGTKDGTQALVVLETDRNATRYVIDGAAYRITRFEFQRGRSPDRSGRQFPNLESYVFSDFRVVSGLATPFKVEHYINGTKQEEVQFASVQYVPANRDTAPGPIRGGLR